MEMFAASAGLKLLHSLSRRGPCPHRPALRADPGAGLGARGPEAARRLRALRVLANWGASRVPSFPDLPTFKELGYGDVEFYIWAGLFTPRNLPEPVATRIREAMRTAMADPEVLQIFEKAAAHPHTRTRPSSSASSRPTARA